VDAENRSRLIRSTALFLFVAGVLGGISFMTPFTVGDFGSFLPYMPEALANESIAVVLLPILGGMAFFYAATLLTIFFEGRLNRVLVSGMIAGGFTGIIAFFMILQPISDATQVAGYLVIGGFSAFFIYNVLAAVAEIRGQHYIRVISGSATIFILGQVCVQLVNLYMVTPGVPESDQVLLIKDMINWGFAVAAVITMIGIFRDSKNAYLAQAGGIASSYPFVGAMSLIGTLYFNFISGRLVQVSPVIRQLSPYVEWTGIVVLGALIFTIVRRGMQESMMVPFEAGAWGKHIQDLSPTKGKALEDFTEIINEFVKEGHKERLLVKLFRFLEENRASEAEIASTLRELIKYEDEKPPSMARKGNSERVQRQNQEKRMELLQRTVGRINQLGLGGLMRETAPVEETGMKIMS
jgi:hypothetical protein